MPRRLSQQSANRLALASLLVAIALWVAIVAITERWAWTYHGPSFAMLYVMRGAMMVVATLAVLLAFVLGIVRQHRSRAVQRLGVAALAVALTLTMLEGLFMFVPRSHNVGYTLGAQIWNRIYWRGINPLGYRDPPHVVVPGKKTVFVVGDSFTAGAGMEHTQDRFGDRVQVEHPELHVLNLGKNGSDTIDEYERLERHPLAPDVVVLQYYMNDIEGAAQRAGRTFPSFQPYADVSWPVQMLLRGSFLLNFLYWEYPHTDGREYVAWLDAALEDDGVMRQHLADLDRFCSYAAKRHIPLDVVLFPFLTDPGHCRAALDRVEALFVQHGAHVVDVGTLIGDIPIEQRTANPYDVHPSARVHERVAVALGKLLTAP